MFIQTWPCMTHFMGLLYVKIMLKSQPILTYFWMIMEFHEKKFRCDFIWSKGKWLDDECVRMETGWGDAMSFRCITGVFLKCLDMSHQRNCSEQKYPAETWHHSYSECCSLQKRKHRGQKVLRYQCCLLRYPGWWLYTLWFRRLLQAGSRFHSQSSSRSWW